MDASDIFFVAGSPYAFKIQKEIIKQNANRLMPEDVKGIVQQLYSFSSVLLLSNISREWRR